MIENFSFSPLGFSFSRMLTKLTICGGFTLYQPSQVGAMFPGISLK